MSVDRKRMDGVSLVVLREMNWRRRRPLVMCRSGGNQLTDAALSLSVSRLVFVDASFDAVHRGPELCCCFEESESDFNGPSCAPACLPLRFTTHLIYSAQTHSHNRTLRTHFLPRLSLLSLSLSLSLPPSVLLASPSPYPLRLHTQNRPCV